MKITNLPPIYEVQTYENKNKIQLPKLSDITDENGKVTLPKWLREELLNPNSQFNGNLIVFCKNTLCGCSCSSNYCVCSRIDASLSDSGFGSASIAGRSRNGEIGGKSSVSLFREVRDGNGDIRFLSASAGGEISKEGIGFQAGVDLMGFKSKGVEARVGVNVDTGITSNDDNTEVKLAGFGFSNNNEQFGISCPLGEVKVDKDDCVIQ